ncbi:MAG: hypothetical protein JNM19_12570, partial [Chitinophagaceae bacterium]|nr:hypothetical protein [Chitinophagaceae bacterium]
ADRLAYIQNTTSPTGINTAMTPAVSLSANDINANRDLDFVEQVRITSTGTLAGSPVDVFAVNGVVSFTTLTHTALGTGLTLNAERTNTLDWDVVSNAFDIIVASSASDYFRSQATGNWNVAATWESSPDNATWQPATLVPDFNANTIYIRNTHVVTANTAITVDQVDVQSGGTLVNQMPLNTGITFANGGAGDDMVIRAGGIYQVIPVDDYADYNILQAGATIHIENSGVISIGNGGALGGGSNHNSFASTSGSYIWDNGAIFDWNTLGFPGTSGVTYFPDAAAGVIPIWRFTVAPTAGFGGGSPLVVNGVLEANDDVIFNGNSNKTFRNGITGTGNVTQAVSTGRMIINGATAVLGGTGIIFPNANNLEIGTGTIVTMTSAKAITGGVVLLSNSYIELGNFNLSVNGTIAGGTTNYVRTNGTGSLILVNVTSLKSAPIGNSTYNPLTINNASGHNWNLRVEDALTVADPTFLPNIIGAVQREWHITPSTNPPATGADIVFQWDDSDPAQVGASYDELQNVQVWHEVPSGMPWGSDWIAAGVAQTATGAPGPGIRTASITGWTWFSPFAVSNINFPLPLKLITFNAVKINSSMANLSWELAGVALPGASFEVEKSADGRSFTS